jgi:hypothetical protein
MKEKTAKYIDKTGCEIVAEFFDDKVQYKKENLKYKKVVTYKKFLAIVNKFGWSKK